MAHAVTITQLPDEESDDLEYVIGGTCDSSCLTWWPCKRARCQKVSLDFLDLDRSVHGIEHQFINGDWMVPSEQCAFAVADVDIDAFDRLPIGTHPVEIEWDGDCWYAWGHLLDGGKS